MVTGHGHTGRSVLIRHRTRNLSSFHPLPSLLFRPSPSSFFFFLSDPTFNGGGRVRRGWFGHRIFFPLRSCVLYCLISFGFFFFVTSSLSLRAPLLLDLAYALHVHPTRKLLSRELWELRIKEYERVRT